MAFTAVAALVTAEAVTATMVLAAVAEVGMALSVVGAVTGSKDLMKIGGAMSLIGGVGGMVAGAASGTAGAAAGAAEAGLGEAATSAALESASSEALAAYGGAAGAEAATASVVSGMEGAAAAGADLAAAAGEQGIFSAAAQPAAAAAEAAPGAMQVGPQVEPTVNDVATPSAPQGPAGAEGPATPYDTVNPTDQRLAAGTQASPMNAPESAGSFFGKMSAFAEKNKTLFSSGMQLVGGAMKGANERDMWNQKMELERQRLKQTSYGNQVARFQPRGIVQGAGA
jgi:hypothetical protein